MLKLITLISTALLFSNYSICQDSAQIVVRGKVLDTLRNLVVPDAGILAKAKSNHIGATVSDSLGNYKLEFSLPIGSNNISIMSDKKGSDIYNLELDVISDSTIQLDIETTPKIMCYDSFLPSTLLFERNQIEPPQDSLHVTRELLQQAANQFGHIFESRVIEISAYCSYDEKESIAIQRAETIKKIALEAGLTNEQIRIGIVGWKEMFICQYCDGCHYTSLHGQGYTLSKDLFNKTTDPIEKEEHLVERRAVMFTWVEK